jgi:hypothetical protein
VKERIRSTRWGDVVDLAVDRPTQDAGDSGFGGLHLLERDSLLAQAVLQLGQAARPELVVGGPGGVVEGAAGGADGRGDIFGRGLGRPPYE